MPNQLKTLKKKWNIDMSNKLVILIQIVLKNAQMSAKEYAAFCLVS